MDAAFLLLFLRLPTIQAEVRFRAESPGHRLAIRAAEFRPEADFLAMAGAPKNHDEGIFGTSKERGAVEGPIRIPLDSLSFLFNVLALPSISSKSLKFQSALFSTSTRVRQALCYQADFVETDSESGSDSN